jgi:hypothetical protein
MREFCPLFATMRHDSEVFPTLHQLVKFHGFLCCCLSANNDPCYAQIPAFRAKTVLAHHHTKATGSDPSPLPLQRQTTSRQLNV